MPTSHLGCIALYHINLSVLTERYTYIPGANCLSSTSPISISISLVIICCSAASALSCPHLACPYTPDVRNLVWSALNHLYAVTFVKLISVSDPNLVSSHVHPKEDKPRCLWWFLSMISGYSSDTIQSATGPLPPWLTELQAARGSRQYREQTIGHLTICILSICVLYT